MWLFIAGIILAAGGILTGRAFWEWPRLDCATQTSVPGELVEWLGYPVGWDLPDDFTPVQVYRALDGDGGLHVYHSDLEHATYYVYYNSYTVDGEPPGVHDFCGPYRKVDE